MYAVNKTSKFDIAGDISMMKLLIENGANINAVNKLNESGQFRVIYSRHKKRTLYSANDRCCH